MPFKNPPNTLEADEKTESKVKVDSDTEINSENTSD